MAMQSPPKMQSVQISLDYWFNIWWILGLQGLFPVQDGLSWHLLMHKCAPLKHISPKCCKSHKVATTTLVLGYCIIRRNTWLLVTFGVSFFFFFWGGGFPDIILQSAFGTFDSECEWSLSCFKCMSQNTRYFTSSLSQKKNLWYWKLTSTKMVST